MSEKKCLSFYTNIPAPYQLSFFNALADYFTLTVIYYSTDQNGNRWELDPEAKYKTIVLKNNFFAKVVQKFVPDFHFSWGILNVFLNDNSDFFIVGGSYWIPNSVIVLIGGKLKKKKIAYFSEALFASKSKIQYGLKWFVLRILNACCDAIFCTGKKAAKSFEDFDVIVRKVIIPYNIDHSKFQPDKIDLTIQQDLLDNYKSNNEFVILSSGFLIPRKGMDILIKAVKAIEGNLKLIILGSGDAENELKTLCEEDKRIIFVGFKTSDQIPCYFSIADLFVLASRYDGWGVVINEAIAANIPVLSSNKVGAAVELITNGVNGIICESENVESFKQQIQSLIDDRHHLSILKGNSKELVPIISSTYNAEMVNRFFLEL